MRWFKEKEFACKCCGELPLSTSSGQAPRANVEALVREVLDPVREQLGKAIIVNIKQHGVFDQLIIYPTFVHVSYKRFGGNRRQVLRKRKGGAGYELD